MISFLSAAEKYTAAKKEEELRNKTGLKFTGAAARRRRRPEESVELDGSLRILLLRHALRRFATFLGSPAKRKPV